MTAYRCPTHGCTFDRDGYPDSVQSCMCPACAQELGTEKLRAQRIHDERRRLWSTWLQCGLPVRARNRTLGNWQPQGRAQQAAQRLIGGYAADIAVQVAGGAGLTLLGPPGVGKTHLACGLISAGYLAGIAGRYVVWADVVDRTKASFASREGEDRRLLDELKRVPLLALDEIGVRAGTEFDQALLFDLIDARYRNERATIVASNLTVDALNAIGERAADRLREVNRTIPIPGDSQRETAAMNRDLIDTPPALLEPEPARTSMWVCINGELVERPVVLRSSEAGL